jgi:CDGSH-type Zn-finger protein
MARLVNHERSKPYIINSSFGESFAVCACGLSKNKPLCDGVAQADA